MIVNYEESPLKSLTWEDHYETWIKRRTSTEITVTQRGDHHEAITNFVIHREMQKGFPNEI